jgi:small subunit ribosomal protein S9
MADEPDEKIEHPSAEQPAAPEQPDGPVAEAAAEQAPAEESVAEEAAKPVSAEEPVAEAAGEQVSVDEPVVEPVAKQPPAEEPAAEQPEPELEPVAEAPAQELPAEPELEPVAEQPEDEQEDEEAETEVAPRVKPSVPGAHLEVDIVPEGVDPLAPERPADPYAIEEYEQEAQTEGQEPEGEQLPEPISTAAIDLAADARYKATGKRKTAIARVILRPGSGTYVVNGRTLDEHFPRATLQRNIRQPLETVGYQERMDVVARLHGGGISAQAGALRHGISRALLEADPNLRGELKRRGFLTRDSRAKERKKAGLKKARKRPQFSKR